MPSDRHIVNVCLNGRAAAVLAARPPGTPTSRWVADLVRDAMRRGDVAIAHHMGETTSKVSVALDSDLYDEVVDRVGPDRVVAYVRGVILATQPSNFPNQQEANMPEPSEEHVYDEIHEPKKGRYTDVLYLGYRAADGPVYPPLTGAMDAAEDTMAEIAASLEKVPPGGAIRVGFGLTSIFDVIGLVPDEIDACLERLTFGIADRADTWRMNVVMYDLPAGHDIGDADEEDEEADGDEAEEDEVDEEQAEDDADEDDADEADSDETENEDEVDNDTSPARVVAVVTLSRIA